MQSRVLLAGLRTFLAFGDRTQNSICCPYGDPTPFFVPHIFALRFFAAMMVAPVVVSAVDDIGAFKPFSIDHRSANPSSLDLSSLLEGPAGATGRIRIVGGHLAKPTGERFRIWGVNLTAFAPGSIRFPAKPEAAFWADTLARSGVNCVRLHSFDVEAPKGIIAAGRNDTRDFDAEQLDRMDYLIAALKQRGIYIDLNLNVGRKYKAGDQVRDFDLIGAAKALTYFDPRLMELQQEYARKLLTHYNPYTQSSYCDEPAVAIVEIVNENSLVGSWIRGRLTGSKTSGPPENWQDITPYYERELTALYHDWLATTLPPARLAALRAGANVAPGQSLPRLKPVEFAAAPRERFETEATFYMEVESRYFGAMQRYLKETLAVKALLIGTSDYSYGKSFYPSLNATATLDIVDSHGPWELSPMVDEPMNSIPVRVSRSAVAGKPFTVSEHNHRFPSDYLCEGIPLLAAYGAFQDWDGIFLYTLELKPPGYAARIETRADLSHDPVKIANLAAGALMFLRADVRPAQETIDRSYSRSQVVDSLLLPANAGGVYFTPGFPATLALEHGVRIAGLNGKPTDPVPRVATSPIVSDTKELSWSYASRATAATIEDDQKFTNAVSRDNARAGVVTIDTARTQGAIGFLHTRTTGGRNLSVQIENTFASVVLSSLDPKPIAQSGRMLLAATARETNSGSIWNAQHTALVKWGGAPTLIEPVKGTITLHGLAPASAVYLAPLDGGGTPMRQRTAATKKGDDWQIALGETATTWFEITVQR
jgi:hypothetical protein